MMFSVLFWNEKYRSDFIRLNKEWIERYFHLEESDFKMFANPGKIVDDGGQVFFAVQDDNVIGCCALVFHKADGRYELAKMAVSPLAQGKGVGRALGEALLSYAESHGVDNIFLEANTKLAASVRLYHKLGFVPVKNYTAAYGRCDLYMEKTLPHKL